MGSGQRGAGTQAGDPLLASEVPSSMGLPQKGPHTFQHPWDVTVSRSSPWGPLPSPS